MTGQTPRIENLTCAGRSSRGGSLAVQGPKLLVWAVLALIAVILIADLISGSVARADDRKTRAITFLSSGLKTAATAQSSAFDVSAYTE